ncbi:signal peptidase I [Oryzihumus leptocrescens]|uniref:Signal peptidase I n=1 Tax=Oryzihumus leptocrescens TaxID=297536 RepID=A0A542Z7P2_9MICO|nr:signal peptidase I [Oryzihumus leptocrescens]TQL56324.1 signal peptidase I [Oryzihumus leptocrescens]
MRLTTRPRSVARMRAHASSVGTAPQRTAPARARRPHRAARRAVRLLGNLVLVLVVTLFAGLAVGPHVFGYRTMTMLTGSMAPGINPGDVTVAVPEPISQLAVGQVITYQIPVDDHRDVSHRVVAVKRQANGTVQIQTKGDHNTGVDPWTAVITDRQVWRVVAVVPHLGAAIQALRGTGLRTVFLYVGPAALAVFLLAGIWRRGGTGDERSGEAPVEQPTPGTLDEEALASLTEEVDDPVCVRDFLTRWNDLLQARLDRVELALDKGQFSAARECALSLQVTSAMIGLTDFADAAAALEAALLEEDGVSASAAFTALRRLAPTASRSLQDHLAHQPN